MGQSVKPLGVKRKNTMSLERLGWIVSGLNWNKLSDKELEFVESCEERMNKVGELTEPMERWLEAIYKNKER